jgi:PAS domain S-box-containing protein
MCFEGCSRQQHFNRAKMAPNEGETGSVKLSRQSEATMEANLRRRVTGGFIVSLLLTIFMGFSSWRSARVAADDADRITRSYTVIEKLNLTSNDVIEVETSAQTFALTGHEPLLAHYKAARDTVAQDKEALRRLTSYNPKQQRRLDVLEPQMHVALDFAETLVTERQQQQAPPSASEVAETQRLIDAMRATTQDMQAEETQLLSQSTRRTRTGRRFTSFIIVAGIFVGAGLLTLARFAVNRQIELVAQARTQITALNAGLEQRVEERTRALDSEIVERKQAEEALKKSLATSECALQDLADQKFALDQHAIVEVTDGQGTITYANGKFCAISQYSEDELIGQNHRILNSGHHPAEFFRQMYLTITNGEVWHGEIRNRAKNGSTYWVDTTIVPFVAGEGRPRQYVAIRADITERKRIEETLREQARVLDLGQVLIRDMDNRIVLWSLGAEKLYGYTREEAVGQISHDLLHTQFHETLASIEEKLRQAGMWEGELVHRSRDGGTVEVTSVWALHEDSHGKPTRILESNTDITQRKADEREILELNGELEDRVSRRTAQLETVNKELEAFSYSVSHDLRAPLRHISGFSKMLEEELGASLRPDAHHYLDRIQTGIQEMGLLVDELLNLARVGRHVLRPQPTQLNSIVAEVIAMLQPDSQGRQVKWLIADLPAVECDPVLVKQVFQNLLANALKFTRPRVSVVIEVSCKEEEGRPVFMVRDNGVGFSMKYVAKLFGVFQRLHSSDEFEGTGIGLVTVQRIVHKHGGRVWADGEVDKGAAFYFTLGEKHAQSKTNEATAGGQ